MEYLKSSELLPSLQSGFRSGHSTETAVLRVLTHILQAVDRRDLDALILLDLSAALDTVDHDILHQHLELSFGISDVAHQWFQSYLLDRPQIVHCGLSMSSITRFLCCVL
jgi:hypothetical protein